MYSTVRAVLPDMRQNIRTVAQTLPVGSMLMAVDQRSQVRHLVAQEIPILNEWGCFDRITPGRTAVEFASNRGPPSSRSPAGTVDAGPTPGPGRHPHPPRAGPGILWRRWRPAGAGSTKARPLPRRELTASVARAPSPAPPFRGGCRGRRVIDKILHPLLSLHGWQAYTLVGLLGSRRPP